MKKQRTRFSFSLSVITLTLLLSAVTRQAIAEPLAYVSNERGSVNVVNLATMQTVKTLDIQAHNPRGLGVSDDGRWLVTANKGEGNISIIDLASGKVVRQVAIGKNPEFVRVRGTIAYVTYEPSVQAGTPPSVAQQSKKDDDDAVPGHIAVVDLQTGQLIRDIVGKPETEGIEFSRDGRLMLVTNESDNSISVHDNASGQLIKTIALGQYGHRPRGIKTSPDGKTYWVTLEFSDKLLVLNDQLQVIHTIATANTPYGIAFNPIGTQVFVANNRAQMLQVFDTTSYAKIKDIPTGAERCWHFTFTPDAKQILLACGKSNALVVVDAEQLAVTQRMTNQSMPWGIVTYPKAMGSLDQALPFTH